MLQHNNQNIIVDIIGVENKDGLANEVISGYRRSSHELVLLASLMLRRSARRGKK